jgi:two-component system, cell cycle sensor histidine kinase and response regulator CckA
VKAKLAVHPTLGYLAKLMALVVLYYATARLGLYYASIGRSVSLIWPPSGIAFAALMLLGYRYWPGVALGAFLANLATDVPLIACAGIATGNTLEALTASYLLRRGAWGRLQLDDLRTVRTLVLVGAPLGALCGALVGPISLDLAGSLPTSLPTGIAVWWAGDLLGMLIVGPLLLAWATPRPEPSSARPLIEILVLCAGTAAAGELGLGRFFGTDLLREVNYPYLLFPFVIWAALRFGVRGASLMTFTVASVAVWRTVQGGSPFVSGTPLETLFSVASYLAIVSITGLVLAAAVRLERAQATQALSASEERLRRALDAARMGTWVWSMESNALTWDANLRELYGLGSDDRMATYEDFIARVHPQDRDYVGREVRKVLEEGGDLDYEFRILLPDGRVRWISDQGEVRRDEGGRPIYLTGVCTDVTDRRMAEERLRQAHRMESVGTLAGGVAHEANNQMSVVLGSAHFILRRSDVPEAVRADVEFIQKAAERTAAVTAQLLAFSRRQVLKPEVIDLNQLVKSWEPVLRRVMGEDHGVRFKLDPEIGHVRCDPGQLEQVLLNLALNARDAMPRGGRITIETFQTELTGTYARQRPGTVIRAGSYVVLAVSDTGHGIDKETLTHIFEPFFTTKGVGQGSGLGLSTVYGIVKQSGGYIWAYSEPGQGTTFKLYLPLRTEAVTGSEETPPPTPAKTGENVLVVEDEAPVRFMMKRALEDAGYGVLDATSAGEALDLARHTGEEISLLLTDVVMPGRNGRELAEDITELFPGLPVLFTSGYTDGEIERRGLLSPGAAFIQKPLSPAALVRAVRQQLEPRRGRDSTR